MDEAASHLRQHAPTERCRNCGEKQVTWALDWDGVRYPRPDLSLWFCDPCGRFAPVQAGEETT